MINRNIAWTACKVELPNNQRPLTIVVDSYDGRHILGAYYKDEKWYEMYTKEEITYNVLCWADFELPETYMI